jgi:hypothetical protein
MIVFGCLAIVYAVVCFVLPEIFATWTWSPDLPPMEAYMSGLYGWYYVDCALILLAALLAIAAGAGLARRRGWAPSACVAWACLKMLVVFFDGVLTYIMQKRMFDEIAADDPSLAGATALVVTLIFVAMMVMWGWALPAFVLIWFARRQVGADIAAWRAAAASPAA